MLEVWYLFSSKIHIVQVASLTSAVLLPHYTGKLSEQKSGELFVSLMALALA